MTFSIGLTANDLKRVAYAGVFAFIGAFASLASGVGAWKNYSDAKSAVLALLPGAIAALLAAIKNGVLADESALKG